jgi:Fe-S cluster assembly protein SufD
LDKRNGLKSTVSNIIDAALVKQIIENGSSPLSGREAAILALGGLPIPSRKTEAFKYTPVAKYLKQTFEPQPAPEVTPDHAQMEGVYTLVFVNGRLSSSLSDEIPDQAGVSIGSIVEYASHPLMDSCFDRSTGPADRFFTHLNTAEPTDGLFVALDRDVQLNAPIRIVHYTSGRCLVQPRDLVVLGDNASAELFFEQRSIGASEAVVNHVRESHVGKGGRLTIHRLQEEQDGPFNICLDSVRIEANGYLDMDTTTLNGNVVRNDIHVQLSGPFAHAQLNGVYMLKGDTHLDNHTYIGHDVPDCTSDELYKGIIDNKATAVFNGKVQVAQDAQRTRAYQSNQNILIEDTASVYTKPELEIYADDVRCSHGCTIGKFDAEALFYLRSRGIGEPEAMRLLTLAFCDDVLTRIENPTWRAHLSNIIEARSS